MDAYIPRFKRADGTDTRISYHKAELVKVQSLFYARRYKQCIALCEELQRSEIHALHKAFLWFYHATSYESMGLIAHNFSGSKLHFLDSARESFGQALKCIPLPYVSTEAGSYEQAANSPVTTDFGSLSIKRAWKAGRRETSATGCVTKLSPSVSSGSIYSIQSSGSEGESIAGQNESPSLQQKYQGKSIPDHHVDLKEGASKYDPVKHPATPAAPAPYQARLQRSFSSRQVLQANLIPSPLFSRNPKRASSLLLDITDNSRPLPPLPFNHRADFKIQGTRIIQDPLMRKTAVQTLIARFEGILPLPLSPPSAGAQSPSREQIYGLETAAASPDVASPRFRMIRDAFSPDPHNEHLEMYLSGYASPALSLYNAHLADFRAQLRKHIAYVNVEIGRVQKIQGERSAARTLGPKQRLASFWSFEVASTISTSKVAPSSACVRRSDDLVRDGCDHPSRCGESRGKIKEEKIDELRRQGWKVCKERHGFRGMGFYENFRRRVEAELEATR
ncbi:hypothetical protein AYO20_08382 [Fonsecaea nubica]|uniref:Uncharacterized protein n=1 Tax=Fonsecaea nubica TaxID=856822 RepID=A0A178CNS0_9EURO|nr:hypothetical protein AYO20_08382 [Fonsecaea nubica]OAL31147.1 hypothetical protein AYO20_08382 [Fonsecaea nubica]